MQSLLFVTAILGCGEGDAPCRELGVAPAQYRSEAACLAASADALARRDDILYPSVVAQCRPANARPQLLRGSDVALPEPPVTRAFRERMASRGRAAQTGL